MAWVITTRVSVSQVTVHVFVCSWACRTAVTGIVGGLLAVLPGRLASSPRPGSPCCQAASCVWLAFCISAATSGGSQSCEAGAPGVAAGAAAPLPAFDMALASREAAVAISFMRFSAPSDWLFQALIFSLKV